MGLQLRVTGMATSTLSDTTPKLSPGADVVIEGFDLATGKTLRSYDAGADADILVGSPPILGSEVVAMHTASGGTVASPAIPRATPPRTRRLRLASSGSSSTA
jgi:hypothetical protein